MSSINTQINLVDRMSSPLHNVISAVEQMIFTVQNVDNAMNQGFDAGAIDNARRSVDLANTQMKEIEANIRQAGQQQEQLNNRVRQGQSEMDGLGNKVMGMVAAYASFEGVKN